MKGSKMDYRFFEDIAAEVNISSESIVSRTLQNDANGKVILFGFDTGQELSEHTASVPAMIHILKGEGDLTLGDDKYAIGPGAYAIMPASMSHSIVAKSPLIMLLVMQSKKEL
jgi:quercetin dioxygenase-like cupin family protein